MVSTFHLLKNIIIPPPSFVKKLGSPASLPSPFRNQGIMNAA